MADRQRLDDIAAPVLEGDEPEHRLVDRPRGVETEARIEGEFHVEKILMGEQLEQGARHLGAHRLAVIGVHDHAPVPDRIIEPAQVLDDLALEQIGEIAVGHARDPVGEAEGRVRGGIAVDAQGADGSVAAGDARIGVKGEGEVEGDAQPRLLTVLFRPEGLAVEIVEILAAAVVIVAIVVLAVVEIVDQGVGQPRVLEIIFAPLGETRLAADRAVA